MSPAIAHTVRPQHWPEIDRLDPSIEVEVYPTDGWYAAAKVAADYALAVLLLVPALPLIAACWAAVRLTSRGPGFYSQTRLGRAGRPYKIIKLRTMTHNAEVASGVAWATKNDSRVTPIGKLLRTTHLDELPQLFNVLLGQMSLVGPRPERPEMIKKKGLNDLVPGYRHRLLVKPGVTGIAQIQLPADEDVSSVRYKVVYDLYYIENANLWLDLRIVAATALKACGLRPAWLRRLFLLPHRDTVAEVFRRNLTPPAPPPLTSLQPA